MIKTIINKILAKFGYILCEIENKNFKKNSYSQCGEDSIIEYVFKLRGISTPSYIDVGANHPFYLNNTASFYERGSRGINIEANKALIEKFSICRPEDININTGIGESEDMLDFYVMEDDTLSSFSKFEVDEMVKNGKRLIEKTKVKITTIQRIINQHCNGVFPDMLSIDVEGLDFQILKTIDFKNNSPKIICVEAAEYSPLGIGARRNELIDFLVNNGYYEYANTNLNAIMVRNDFWFQK